jgi:hypothetical protein
LLSREADDALAIYPQGKPAAKIHVKHVGGVVSGLALDSADDVYFEYAAGRHIRIGELVAATSGYASPVDLPITAALVQGTTPTTIAIDGNGNFVVGTQNGIGVYPPGASTPLYTIGSTVPICGDRFAIDSLERFIVANDCHGKIWVFCYPSGTPYAAYADPWSRREGKRLRASAGGTVRATHLTASRPWPGQTWRKVGVFPHTRGSAASA